MSLEKYYKHQRSRFKKYVASDEEGNILFETNSKSEFAVLNKKHEHQIEDVDRFRVKVAEKVTPTPKPQFDPDTGERILE